MRNDAKCGNLTTAAGYIAKFVVGKFSVFGIELRKICICSFCGQLYAVFFTSEINRKSFSRPNQLLRLSLQVQIGSHPSAPTPR